MVVDDMCNMENSYVQEAGYVLYSNTKDYTRLITVAILYFVGGSPWYYYERTLLCRVTIS